MHGFVCVREKDKEVNDRRIKKKGGGVIAETTIDDADAFWPERGEEQSVGGRSRHGAEDGLDPRRQRTAEIWNSIGGFEWAPHPQLTF